MNSENEKLFAHENSMPEQVEEILSTLDLDHNNIDAKPAHFRDTFLDAEKDYVLELLKIDDIKDMIRTVNWHDSSQIFKKAEEIVYKVENNLIPYEEMEKVEMKLTILFAAIKDKVLVRILECYPDYEEEKEKGYGRSR